MKEKFLGMLFLTFLLPFPFSSLNDKPLVFGFTGVKAVFLCVYPDLWVFVYPLVICVSNPSILRWITRYICERDIKWGVRERKAIHFYFLPISMEEVYCPWVYAMDKTEHNCGSQH